MLELKFGKRRVVKYRGAKTVIGGLTTKNKIDILLYISKELATISNQEQLFERVISLSQEIFEADNITLRLLQNDMLDPVAFLKQTDPPRRPLSPGEGYSGTVFNNKESVLYEDLSIHPELLDPEEKTLCVMCVPVINLEEVLGTLAIEKDSDHFYRKDDMEILEAMSSQIALALTNVRLFEKMRLAQKKQARVQEQLEWDLRMGRNVQTQIIPAKIPPWNGLYADYYYEPMVQVSGDYFDVVRKGESLTVIIADVSGHGTPAALVTMAIHYHFKLCIEKGLALIEILEELSETIRPILPDGVYFTAQLVRIHGDHSFSYINAGHQKLAHYNALTKTFEELDTPGLPVGFVKFDKSTYKEKYGKLLAGDMLVLLTDGFTEQRNASGEETGIQQVYDWLIKFTEKSRHLPVAESTQNLCRDFISTWKKSIEPLSIEDDLTLVVLQCNPEYEQALTLHRDARSEHLRGNDTEAWGKAISAYRADPSLKDNLLFLARMSYRDEKFEDAARYLREFTLTSGESNSNAHFMLGNVLFKASKFSDAKREFKKSLSIDPTLSRASMMLARCYLREKAENKALRTLQTALKNAPSDQKLKRAIELMSQPGRHLN